MNDDVFRLSNLKVGFRILFFVLFLDFKLFFILWIIKILRRIVSVKEGC